MTAIRSDILTSRGFLLSLSLLVVNDFFLKSLFHNPLTGKLSDFAGLFAFTLFWTAIFPGRQREILLAVAVGFLFWKSSLSQPLIDWWNAFGLVRFSRTVDLTDLIALSILPPAYCYAGRKVSTTAPPNWVPTSLALIAVFAFGATSYSTKYEDYNNKYYFAGSKAELFKRIDYLRLDYYDRRFDFDRTLHEDAKKVVGLELEIPSSMCFDSFHASLRVVEVDGQTEVTIKQLQHSCPKRTGDREELLAEFEKEFIQRLLSGTEQTKHIKVDVETPGFKRPPARRPSPLQASPGRAPGKS